MGKILYEGEWRTLNLALANLTSEKTGGSFLPGDDLQIPIGSLSLNNVTVAEYFNGINFTFEAIVGTYFIPGDGLIHYLFDNQGTGASEDRVRCFIDGAGLLTFVVHDTDSTQHLVSHDVTDWKINDEYYVVCTLDFNANTIVLFVGGTSEDSTPDNALSADSVAAIESDTHIGSDTNGANYLNGKIKYRFWDRPLTASEITAQWNGGDMVEFSIISPDVIAMDNFTQSGTGINGHHSGQKISSISTVTLTMAEAVGSRWVVGKKVLAFDDDDPANAVYTEIVSAAGSEVEVADSCAALTGTNKRLSYNLLIDPGMESAGVANVTEGANQTITKDSTVKFKDSQSLKDVWAAADDNDESTIWSPTLVTDENYVQRFRVRKKAMAPNSQLFVDIDGATTPILSRQLAGVGNNGNWIGSVLTFDGDDEYMDLGTIAVGNPLQLNGVVGSIVFWIKPIDSTGRDDYARIVDKSNGPGGANGYALQLKTDGKISVQIDGGSGVDSNGSIDDDIRSHVVIIFNGGSSKFYINGILDSTVTFDTIPSVETNMRIGSWNIGDGREYKGDMANIMIFQVEMVQADVTWLYQNANPTRDEIFANTSATEAGGAGNDDLVLYHNYGTETLTDLSEYGNDGTHSGVASYESEWALVEQCWKADQADIEINLRATGAGAGANAVEVNVDAGQLRVNLIENGGMESFSGGDPNIPTGWLANAYMEAGDMVKAGNGEADTTRHSGDYCAKYIVAVNEGIYVPNLALVPNANYTFSMYMKGDAGGELIVVKASSYSNPIDESFTLTSSWAKYTFTFNPGATAISHLNIRVTDFPGTQTFYLDDVSLIKNDYADASTDSKASALWPKTNPKYIG